MKVYHFTSTVHLPMILNADSLRPTESNVGSPIPSWPPFGDRVGPDVVWLLDVPEPEHDHGLGGSPVDKTEVRFTLDLPEDVVPKWTQWRPAKRMHPEWREGFLRAAGGMEAAKQWRVYQGWIPSSLWQAVEIRQPDGSWAPARV